MKTWHLLAPQNLQHDTVDSLVVTKGKAKVKITKALLSESDYYAYLGQTPVKYPLTLGRFAIGVAMETDEASYIKKFDRIYFSDVIDDENAPDGLRVAGESCEGFFKDFALVDGDNAFILPESVSDESAFLIDAIATAEHIINKANITVGQHVLVYGGGIYANVFSQILMYHRAVPIFADNNAEHIEYAKKCGIYYTFPNDETLKDNVLQVTGGKLADVAVYFAYANKSDASAVFSLVARNATVCFVAKTLKNINVNLSNAIKNNVVIKCIAESRAYISTAINLLANKTVNFSLFKFITKPEDEIEKTFKSLAENKADPAVFNDLMYIFKFIL